MHIQEKILGTQIKEEAEKMRTGCFELISRRTSEQAHLRSTSEAQLASPPFVISGF